MKQFIALFFVLLMTFSCVSGAEERDVLDDLRDELRNIEREAKSGDVEEMIREFRKHLDDAGKELADLNLDEEVFSWDWVDELQSEGWLNELEKQAELFIEAIKEIDSEQIAAYGKEIKKYARKLEKNIFETAAIVGDYIKEKAEDFSTSDFVKALTEIWKE